MYKPISDEVKDERKALLDSTPSGVSGQGDPTAFCQAEKFHRDQKNPWEEVRRPPGLAPSTKVVLARRAAQRGACALSLAVVSAGLAYFDVKRFVTTVAALVSSICATALLFYAAKAHCVSDPHLPLTFWQDAAGPKQGTPTSQQEPRTLTI